MPSVTRTWPAIAPTGPSISTASPLARLRASASEGCIHTKFSVVVSRSQGAAMVRCEPFVRAFQLMKASGRSGGCSIGVPSANATGAGCASPSKFSPVRAFLSEAVFGS